MIADPGAMARYIMIGGFLGAGKTTAVAALGRYLMRRGLRVGFISNDQSTGLVDTAMLRSQGFDVEEIAGGCFCCRFPSLLEAANKLTEASRPDVFVAEPVGSCTDLVATVSYPLRRIYGHRFRVAPLSVLVDPNRCARILGLAQGRSFSSKVTYVYRKQLEEANLIVINKCDAVEATLQNDLEEALSRSFPQARIFRCSARAGAGGAGLEPWFNGLISTEAKDTPTMSIDYDTYAEGEALLGWMNCTIRLSSADMFDANAILADLAKGLREKIDSAGYEIAHLKMTLDSGDEAGNLAVVSVVGSDAAVDVRESLLDRVGAGHLVINLRAEADPEFLRTATLEVVDGCVRATPGLASELEHLEHFRPGKPEPTHRITVSA